MEDENSSKPDRLSNLINPKKYTYVATMNVRTIRLTYLRYELGKLFSKLNIDILGIQEHRIVHEDPIRYEEIMGSTLITSSAWRNEQGAACGGVGVVLNNKAKKSLANVIPFSDRILVVNVSGNPAVTTIITYCPTECATMEDAEMHYNMLKQAIHSVPSHNVLLVIGDFNARIGKKDAKFTYHEDTNRNGKLLLELSAEKNMDISNTRFQKKPGKLWTFLADTTGRKAQLDYIVINKKRRYSIKNVEAYNGFASIGSDHRVLRAA